MKSTNPLIKNRAMSLDDLILKREVLISDLETTLTKAGELHAEAFETLIDIRRAAKDAGLDNRNLPGELDPGDFQVRVYEFFRSKSVSIPCKPLIDQVAKEHGALRVRLDRMGGK